MNMLEHMNHALRYIEAHLKDEIAISHLAAITGYSVYHLQRMFVAFTDIPISEYIRRRRLTSAAYQLQSTSRRIIDIALDYGYQSPDAFTRAFQNMHGITPSEARKTGAKLRAYPPLTFTLTIKGVKPMDYTIQTKEAFRIVGMKKWFSTENNQQLQEIPKFWRALTEEQVKYILSFADEHTYGLLGVCGTVHENGFEYWIAIQTDKPCPEDLFEMDIPATTWAIFENRGRTPDVIQDIFKQIYSEWLPNSQYEHAQTPEVEWYGPEFDGERDDNHCAVWLPVVKKA